LGEGPTNILPWVPGADLIDISGTFVSLTVDTAHWVITDFLTVDPSQRWFFIHPGPLQALTLV
jgi:hypothetical protein